MRDFSKVSPRLWQSVRFRNLPDDDARFLYLFLLTCPHNNSAGAFRLPTAYAAADLGWTADRLGNSLGALAAGDMIERDSETEELFVLRWFNHNPPTNRKHLLGIERLISEIDSDAVREAAEGEVSDHAERIHALPAAASGNGSRLTNSNYMRGP